MPTLPRTDLAFESVDLLRNSAEDTTELPGVKATEETRRGFRLTHVHILDERGAGTLCKPIGHYLTLDVEPYLRREARSFTDAAELLSELIREFLPLNNSASALIGGLGNRSMTPDALGPLVTDSVLVTRHLRAQLPEEFGRFTEVTALAPGVLGTTGLESAQLLRAIAGDIRPARLVVVDALASASLDRLCRTIQLTDAGIVPGSGVGNDREALNRETFGVPVLAIGVPTVVDAATFAPDAGGTMFVTPRDIDARVRDMAKLIAYGINLALHDGLTLADVDMLVS